MKNKILLIFGFLLVLSLTFIPADSVLSKPSVCCEKTTEGAWCVNTEESQCNKEFKISSTSCETISYGEVEDYTVTFVPASNYCDVTHTSPLSYFYIDNVTMGEINNTTTLENNSTCYSNYTSQSASVQHNNSYNLSAKGIIILILFNKPNDSINSELYSSTLPVLAFLDCLFIISFV